MKGIQNVYEKFVQELKDVTSSDEKVLKERISYQMEELFDEIISISSESQSPIEKLFAIEFNKFLKRNRLYSLLDVFQFDQQYPIETEDPIESKNYIVDFLITCSDYKREIDCKFAIECDGHEFHEKTKEQVAKDRERDRLLLEEGIITIRFTGSEIVSNPPECARQAVRIIDKYVTEMYK